MSKEDFNNALNHIDYNLVEEYVAEKERMRKRTVQRRAFMKIVPIAVCFVLIITFSITILPMLLNGSFDNVLSTSLINESFQEPPTTDESDGTTSDAPEGPGIEIEGNNPEGPGGAEDGQKPGDTGESVAGIYTYSFQYEGMFYMLSFNSLEEIYEKAISADNRGNYIATVSVYDRFNDKEILCPIYESLGASGIIVELFDGLYFVVE